MSGWPTRLALAAAAGIVALIVFAIAMCYLAEALVSLLEAAAGLNAALSALIVGVVGLIVVAVIGLVARCLARPHRPAAAALPATTDNTAAQLGGLVAQQLVSATRARPYTTMGAALLAGLAIGAVPELRKALTGLFKH